MAHLLGTCNVLGRRQSVKRFGDWLLGTDRIPATSFFGVKGRAHRRPSCCAAPTTSSALVGTCTSLSTDRTSGCTTGPPDEALTRPMAEIGIRAGEVVALECVGLDFELPRIFVRRGKDRLFHTIPVGANTSPRSVATSPKRPRSHGRESTALAAERGASFGYDGLNRALRRRARRAGIDGFHAPAAARCRTAGSPPTALRPVSWQGSLVPRRHAWALDTRHHRGPRRRRGAPSSVADRRLHC